MPRLLCGLGFFYFHPFRGFFSFASNSFSQAQTLCSNPCWLLCLTARQSALRCLYGICLLLSHRAPAESMRSFAARSEHQHGQPGAEPDCGNVSYVKGRRQAPLLCLPQTFLPLLHKRPIAGFLENMENNGKFRKGKLTEFTRWAIYVSSCTVERDADAV